MRRNDHAMTIQMPSSLYQELKAEAEHHDRTIASILRQLAREHLAAGPRNGDQHPSVPLAQVVEE